MREVRETEQPREPRFYTVDTDDEVSIFAIGEKNGGLYAVGKKDNALQSIDATLKRIESILLERKNPLQALRDAVEASASQLQGQPLVLCPCSQDLLRQPAPTNSQS